MLARATKEKRNHAATRERRRGAAVAVRGRRAVLRGSAWILPRASANSPRCTASQCKAAHTAARAAARAALPVVAPCAPEAEPTTCFKIREGMHGAPSHPTKRLHKSPCSPSAAKILPLRGADCSALRRTISFMGEARRKRLQVRTKSTKTRSSPRRFWKSRSRSSILHGAPARRLAMHWATPGEQWLLPLRHSSIGTWLKPCPW